MRRVLALVIPTLIIAIILAAGTTMAIQPVKAKLDTPNATIVKEVITLKHGPKTPYNTDLALSPYSAVLIGPFTLSSSQGIAIFATWSPSNAIMFLGVVNANTLTVYGYYFVGGAGFAVFRPGAGSWFVIVYNDSPYTVSTTIYIFLFS